MTVTALLVSHDGARWLPAVLAGLSAQTRLPDRVVAVDTGSSDGSLELLREHLGAEAVVQAPPDTSYPEAVQLGLDHTGAHTERDADEWVWLHHDDAAPAPNALEALLAAAEADGSVSILGPKLREWPSLRRLLEVGVTITGTGRRETGLERGEYDQAQHDLMRDVLAVNTAGMLVRRAVLDELRGFDPRLPLFGNDIDLGWRAARAGHRTLVVPEAVLFHVEAAHRGVRRASLFSGSPRRGERQAALYTILVNCSLLALPFQLVRLFLGTLVRALGLLLVRAPREAWDELLALLATYLRPDRLVAGRSERRRTATLPPRAVRHLLPPPWLPYRHGLDFVSDVAAAVVHQASEVSARRSRPHGEAEPGPVAAEAQSLPPDTGVLSRLFTSPTAAVFGVLVVLALVATRGVLGSGFLAGGALLPAPETATAWWQRYLETWHEVGVGSSAPAPPFVLPLAVLGSLLFGKAWLVLDLLFLLAVPLSSWGAYRFLGTLTKSPPARLWGAVTYGLVPVLTGAVNQGRLGTVVAAVVLPWAAHAALHLGSRHSTDRRWRAAWRTGLLLALLSAFVPMAWPLALLLAALVAAVSLVAGNPAWRRGGQWGPVAVAVAVVPVLLLPWSLLVLLHGPGAPAWLQEAGLPAARLTTPLGAWDLVLGRAGDVAAAPAWISAGVAVAAVAALLRADTRPRVLASWLVLLVGLGAAAALSGMTVVVPATGEEQLLWLGLPVLLAQGAGITAAVVAADGISRQFAGTSFGWRQPVAALVVAAALLSPLAGLVWWSWTGVEEPLSRTPAQQIPTYMAVAAETQPHHGVLVIQGSHDQGLRYHVVRGHGLRVGDGHVMPTVEEQQKLTAVVRRLATSPEAQDVATLSDHAVEFVYLPAPADPVVAGNLDSVSGLTSASAIRPASRAWQLEASPTGSALATPDGSARPWLLLAQGAALVLVAVLAAPSRRVRP